MILQKNIVFIFLLMLSVDALAQSDDNSLLTSPLEEALDRAWNFTGTSNDDWQAYIHTFEEGHEMALVPVGCFMMGSTDWFDDEQPVTQQCIEEPFWVDVTEITNQEYGSTGCTDWSSEPEQPRNCINWFDAMAYCQERGASLPTELQWEYTARGVESLIYPWGNEWTPDNVNWVGTEPREISIVGTYPTGNSWVGASDMAGNVWEWVSSTYEDYPIDMNARPENSARVLRGGSFVSTSGGLRSAARFDLDPYDGSSYFGFRCVVLVPTHS